jgi:hypothetical protein
MREEYDVLNLVLFGMHASSTNCGSLEGASLQQTAYQQIFVVNTNTI